MSVGVTSTRRSFVGRMFQAGAALATTGGGAIGYGSLVERHHPVIDRVTIPLPGLGRAWQGFRIVQSSDLHLEPLHDSELLQRVVHTVNGLKPDLVALTGDYVTRDASDVARLSAPLAALNAPAGVFACPGNHDLWSGVAKVSRALKEHGITYLSNTGHGLSRRNETLWIAGLDSAWGGHPRIKLALKGRPVNAATVVLIHEPDYADALATSLEPLLQLSGHTHGGQVCMPGGRPLRLPTWGRRYPKGLFRVGDVRLYVNRGIGCTNVPLRFGCPPEVTEITLSCV